MKLWQQILLILSLSFISAAISVTFQPIEMTPKDPFAISAHDFKKLNYKNLILLDVRSSEKFDQAHFPQAMHFDPSLWEESFGKLMESFTGDETIYTYCDTGCGSSKTVAQQLRDAGLEKVFFIHNGWSALKSKDLKE